MAMAAKRTRDYRKEYKRRIALAEQRVKELGIQLSRSQARGHARVAKREMPIALLKRNRIIRPERESTIQRFTKALRSVFAGESVTAAAKKARMSPRTLKRIGQDRGVFEHVGERGRRRYRTLGVQFTVITSDGRLHEGVTFDRVNASVMGQYWNAVQAARDQQSATPLKPFTWRAVTDVRGKKYRLLTNLDRLDAIFDEMSPEEQESFVERLYRKLGHAA